MSCKLLVCSQFSQSSYFDPGTYRAASWYRRNYRGGRSEGNEWIFSTIKKAFRAIML